MEVIEKIIDKNLQSNLFNEDDNICFLDIETTGFSRKYALVYLVGIMYYDKSVKSWKLLQVFANHPDEEKDLLLETFNLLSQFDLIINYNGTSFDLPFLNARFKENKLELRIDKEKSLDIYSHIRKNKDLFDLPNMKLETIEEYLGIYREDSYSGGECIEFYNNYVEDKQLEDRDKILLHNYEDLYYLLDIVKILDEIHEKTAFVIEDRKNEYIFFIEKVRFYKSYLLVNGDIISDEDILKGLYYKDDYEISIYEDSTFQLKITTQLGRVGQSQTATFFDLRKVEIDKLKSFKGVFLIPKNIPNNICILKIEEEILNKNILNLSHLLISSIF